MYKRIQCSSLVLFTNSILQNWVVTRVFYWTWSSNVCATQQKSVYNRFISPHSYTSNVNCVSTVEFVINCRKLIGIYSTVGSLPCLDNWCPSVVIMGHEGGSKLRDQYALRVNTIHYGCCWIRMLTLPLCVRVCRYCVPKHPIIVRIILVEDNLIVTPRHRPVAMLLSIQSILPCYTYEWSRVLRDTPV
jgi:hypothetical protein